MGHGEFSLRADISGIAEGFHIMHMIPMQVGEDADINLLRVYPHIFQKDRALHAASLFTFMMVPGCSFFISKSGIDHDLIFTGIDIEAQSRVPYLLTSLSFPEQIGSDIGFESTGVNRIYAGIFYGHLRTSVTLNAFRCGQYCQNG